MTHKKIQLELDYAEYRQLIISLRRDYNDGDAGIRKITKKLMKQIGAWV